MVSGREDGNDDRSSDMTGITPPDGGWGWVVVFSSFMIHVLADGIMYTFGIFYVELLRYYGSSKAATSWVASIMVGTTFCVGPMASALTNRYGCRVVTIAGSVLASLGFLLSITAPCITYLYFTIGILTGTGLGLIYLPAIVSVTCYFEKRRAFATGIAVCGSGMGTFAMAPFTEFLVAKYGWKGGMLIVAGLILNCCVFGALFRPLEPSKKDDPWPALSEAAPAVVAPEEEEEEDHKKTEYCPPQQQHNAPLLKVPTESPDPQLGVLYRKDIFYSRSLLNIPEYKENPEQYHSSVSLPREPKSKGKLQALRRMFDLALLTDVVFLLFGLSNFFTNIGFNVPYVYTKHRVQKLGVEEDQAGLLLSAIGISNTVGRVLLGYLSDQPWVNRLWLYNTSLVVNGLATAFSNYCVTYNSMVAYSMAFGFTAGAYVSLTSVILVDLLGLDKLTNAFGLLLVFEGLACLIGPPITGWLYDITGSYDPGFVVSGVMIAISGFMLYCIPCLERWRKDKDAKTSSNRIV
ncbi:Mct1 [Cordylochernes scorpioides]|uniref:Mct1 n=1 Tax=Cordylochernes scorpioides TaxID=51811 RepID=A0ABY6LD33_9ARAC|nr:Mct1 [Cordylochernes scorpioides]